MDSPTVHLSEYGQVRRSDWQRAVAKAASVFDGI